MEIDIHSGLSDIFDHQEFYSQKVRFDRQLKPYAVNTDVDLKDSDLPVVMTLEEAIKSGVKMRVDVGFLPDSDLEDLVKATEIPTPGEIIIASSRIMFQGSKRIATSLIDVLDRMSRGVAIF